MTRVTLRLPEDLHDRLRAASRRTGASLNQLIVAAISESMARVETEGKAENALQEQIRHIRTALGDLLVEVDTTHLPPHIRPGADVPDHEAFRRSMPHLDPPLSATIIADREDRL